MEHQSFNGILRFWCSFSNTRPIFPKVNNPQIRNSSSPFFSPPIPNSSFSRLHSKTASNPRHFLVAPLQNPARSGAASPIAAAWPRWLRHASDPAFLRLFRARHRPKLLGFYASHRDLPRPQFVPVSQAPELATAIRAARFPYDSDSIVRDCRDGRGLLVDFMGSILNPSPHAVVDLLRPARGQALLPPLPPYPFHDGMFLPEDCGGGAEGVVAVTVHVDDSHDAGTTTTVYAKVHTFQSGAWTVRTTPEIELPESYVDFPEPGHGVMDMTPPSEGKIYITTDSGYFLVLDLAIKSLCAILLPNRVMTTNLKLICRQEDSGLFFIHAEGHLLSIWHYKADDDGTHNWVLVHDKIIVHESCNRHEDVFLMGVDDNLEYVFLWLETSELLMHMHLKSRNEKVYDELAVHGGRFLHISPFMMIWPPVFPTLREENILEE